MYFGAENLPFHIKGSIFNEDFDFFINPIILNDGI